MGPGQGSGVRLGPVTCLMQASSKARKGAAKSRRAPQLLLTAHPLPLNLICPPGVRIMPGKAQDQSWELGGLSHP